MLKKLALWALAVALALFGIGLGQQLLDPKGTAERIAQQAAQASTEALTEASRRADRPPDIPVTRGSLADSNTARAAIECAHGYLAHPDGPAEEFWILCAQSTASLDGRDVINVANWVIRYQNENVFEPKGGGTLSDAMIARLRSGK